MTIRCFTAASKYYSIRPVFMNEKFELTDSIYNRRRQRYLPRLIAVGRYGNLRLPIVFQAKRFFNLFYRFFHYLWRDAVMKLKSNIFMPFGGSGFCCFPFAAAKKAAESSSAAPADGQSAYRRR